MKDPIVVSIKRANNLPVIHTPYGQTVLRVKSEGISGHFSFILGPDDSSLPLGVAGAIREASEKLVESLPNWKPPGVASFREASEEETRIAAVGLPDSFYPNYTQAIISFRQDGWDIKLKF